MKNWGLPRHFELGERCHFADGQNSDKNDQSNIPRPALSYTRHSRESGNPLCSDQRWTPAFAGVTTYLVFVSLGGSRTQDHSK